MFSIFLLKQVNSFTCVILCEFLNKVYYYYYYYYGEVLAVLHGHVLPLLYRLDYQIYVHLLFPV